MLKLSITRRPPCSEKNGLSVNDTEAEEDQEEDCCRNLNYRHRLWTYKKEQPIL